MDSFEFLVVLSCYWPFVCCIFVPATIVGHVGDGNFHACILADPNSTSDMGKMKDLANRAAE